MEKKILISLKSRWPNIECWLESFVIFQGMRTSIHLFPSGYTHATREARGVFIRAFHCYHTLFKRDAKTQTRYRLVRAFASAWLCIQKREQQISDSYKTTQARINQSNLPQRKVAQLEFIKTYYITKQGPNTKNPKHNWNNKIMNYK